MSAKRDLTHVRRYLLGEASEEECAAVERRYFGDDEAADRIAAAEDDLIDDYLADRLERPERARFEHVYLSNPHRRRRVETIRQLKAAARSQREPRSRTKPATSPLPVPWQWGALAATLILVAAATMWLLGPPTENRGAVAEDRPSTPPRPAPSAEAPPPTPPVNAPPRPPRIVAMSLSPATVRSAGDGAVLSVPPGTDIVTLHLEAGGDRRPLGDARATVRAVAGDEVWQGAPVVDTTLPAGVAARVDVPASRLPVDDYIVTLFSAAAGTEQERAQYFLRVRPQ